MKLETLRARVAIGVNPRPFAMAVFRCTSHVRLHDVRLREASTQSKREGLPLEPTDAVEVEAVRVGNDYCLAWRRPPFVRIDEGIDVYLVNEGTVPREVFVEVDVEPLEVVDATFEERDTLVPGVGP